MTTDPFETLIHDALHAAVAGDTQARAGLEDLETRLAGLPLAPPAPAHRRTPRYRVPAVAAALLLLVAVGAVAIASRRDGLTRVVTGAKNATIEKLAVGTWTCASDDPTDDKSPFTVTVTAHGTFSATVDDANLSASENEVHGTWKVQNGTLDWGFKDIPMEQRFSVRGFSALTPDSTEFTLDDPGPFTLADTPDPDHQKILTTVHGTDAVTLRFPQGEPWTCRRQ